MPLLLVDPPPDVLTTLPVPVAALMISAATRPSQAQATREYHPFPDPSAPLPNAYVWPKQDRPTLGYNDFGPVDMPVVDLFGLQSDLELPTKCNTIKDIASACLDWGIFYVVNHGIPESLIQLVHEHGRRLFSIPLDQKMRAHRDGGFAGYGKAVIGKFFDSLMWSEGFTMIGSPNSCIRNLINRLWPTGEEEEISAAFEEYDLALRNLALKLLYLILEGLRINMDRFQLQQFHLQECQGGLQLNFYPPCPDPSRTVGLPAHTDSTCLTILHQGEVPGLQFCKDGQWIAVPPKNAAFVVHVGDMLQILSNSKYKSVLHQVAVNKTTPRLSLAYLCGPPPEATIRPAAELVDSENPPLYRSLTWKEYLQARSKYFMGAMETFTETR